MRNCIGASEGDFHPRLRHGIAAAAAVAAPVATTSTSKQKLPVARPSSTKHDTVVHSTALCSQAPQSRKSRVAQGASPAACHSLSRAVPIELNRLGPQEAGAAANPRSVAGRVRAPAHGYGILREAMERELEHVLRARQVCRVPRYSQQQLPGILFEALLLCRMRLIGHECLVTDSSLGARMN